MTDINGPIQNLSENVFDLTMLKEINSRKDPQELKYGIDYDYIIESFYAEYKLNVKELQSIQAQYEIAKTESEKQELRNQFHKLWPEYTSDDILRAEIPETILKKLYYVQSPKGADGLPSKHYSLKEKMLSDLRAIRSRVKKQMEKAAEAHDRVSEVRYNAQQLAIKVVCNSEYGASNNEHFPHYDPDVPATTTCTSRRYIGLLTMILEARYLFVDMKFLQDNAKQIELLQSINCIHITKDTSFNMNEIDKHGNPKYLQHLRHSIRRLYDDCYRIINPDNIYRIDIEPSTVCYQDTDSNYYRNEYITNYFTKIDDESFCCDPDIINDCMHAMLAHNELMANFVRAAIQRRPYALGFEGAFIVCRYLNRKKKYYGIKWGDDAELRLGTRLADEAYELDGTLKQNYLPWWKPKKTVLPQPNGEYIYLDNDKLLHQGVNYLDYIRGQNVKCTGVDLARRDQYKFINYFHMKVLQQDLRIMKYLGDNTWEMITTKESIKDIVDIIIDLFHNIMKQYAAIGMLKSDSKPSIDFNIYDFAKTSAYRPGKINTTATIIERLKSEGKNDYIPSIGERISFVVILDEKTENDRLQGKTAIVDLADRSFVIQELLDELYLKYNKDDVLKAISTQNLNLTYDEFINAKLISKLDMKYYLECLCKSMALYVVGDIYPNEIQQIDDGTIDSKQANALISKLQSSIAKEYLQKYFPSGKLVKAQLRTASKSINIKLSENDCLEMVYAAYPQLKDTNPTLKDRQDIIAETNDAIERNKDLAKKLDKVYKHILTNKFAGNIFNDKVQSTTFNTFKDNVEGLAEQLQTLKIKIGRLENILTTVEKWKVE